VLKCSNLKPKRFRLLHITETIEPVYLAPGGHSGNFYKHPRISMPHGFQRDVPLVFISVRLLHAAISRIDTLTVIFCHDCHVLFIPTLFFICYFFCEL
jgi:hypothetical protein